MNRRAQAEVITTVLIILLVLASIVVVWNVVRSTISKGVQKANISPSDVLISSSQAVYSISGGELTVSVRRDAGAGNLVGMKFIIRNESGAYNVSETRDNLIGELGSFDYVVDSSSVENPNSIEVYPIIDSKGTEILGLKAVPEIYIIS